MVLSDVDRQLLQRCLSGAAHAWEEFVDRFLGLVLHVVDHAARSREIKLSRQDREDLSAEVFLTLIANDLKILRRFRGKSSLATYLTVVARRVVVREMLRRRLHQSTAPIEKELEDGAADAKRWQDTEQVDRLLRTLQGDEADIVRMFYLEGRSYREISDVTGRPENSIGPVLSRAKAKLKKAAASETLPN